MNSTNENLLKYWLKFDAISSFILGFILPAALFVALPAYHKMHGDSNSTSKSAALVVAALFVYFMMKALVSSKAMSLRLTWLITSFILSLPLFIYFFCIVFDMDGSVIERLGMALFLFFFMGSSVMVCLLTIRIFFKNSMFK